MKYGLFGFMMPVLCGKVMLPYAKSMMYVISTSLERGN